MIAFFLKLYLFVNYDIPFSSFRLEPCLGIAMVLLIKIIAVNFKSFLHSLYNNELLSDKQADNITLFIIFFLLYLIILILFKYLLINNLFIYYFEFMLHSIILLVNNIYFEFMVF